MAPNPKVSRPEFGWNRPGKARTNIRADPKGGRKRTPGKPWGTPVRTAHFSASPELCPQPRPSL